MSARGVFAVDRDIWNDADFADEPFSEREAFLWLVGEAAWKAKRVRVGSAPVSLERGQCAFSTRFMAAKWKWSEARVRRFLGRMKKSQIIDAHADAHATHITICKYDKFQRVGLPNDAPFDAGATQERRKEETGKHINNSVLTNGQDEPADLEERHPEKTEPAKPDQDAQLFERGREVLGKGAGGQIAKLKAKFDGSIPKARAAIEVASTKAVPAEYVAAVIRGPPPAGSQNQKRMAVIEATERLLAQCPN